MQQGIKLKISLRMAFLFKQSFFQQILNKMEQDSDYVEEELVDGRWHQQQHERFLFGIIKYGKDWRQVEETVKSRRGPQVRSHAQKYFLKLIKFAKEKKKSSNKGKTIQSDIQTEILNLFSESDITEKTPIEMAAIIRNDWSTVSYERKKLKKNKNKLKKRKTYSNQKNDPQQNSSEHHMDLDEQKLANQESYFVQLLKYNKEFFTDQYQQLKQYSQMNPHSERKISFTLPEEDKGNQSQEILKERIDKVHKAMQKQIQDLHP